MSCDESSETEETWVQWFCSLEGNHMFCEVDRSYIEDAFNLYGLRQYISNMSESLDVILDRIDASDSDNSEEDSAQTSCLLYGLIHARYITTANGLEAMYHKYSLHEFGHCPRLLCRGQPVVPIGLRDEPKMDSVKIFCPKCQDVYNCPTYGNRAIDGSFFGTTFAHLFFMTFEHLIPPPCLEVYTPTVFGFRIHHSSKASSRRYREHVVFKKRLLESSNTSVPVTNATSTAAGTVERSELVVGDSSGARKVLNDCQKSGGTISAANSRGKGNDSVKSKSTSNSLQENNKDQRRKGVDKGIQTNGIAEDADEKESRAQTTVGTSSWRRGGASAKNEEVAGANETERRRRSGRIAQGNGDGSVANSVGRKTEQDAKSKSRSTATSSVKRKRGT